jgi:AbrB family looped-hinge helix DNA binding protein
MDLELTKMTAKSQITLPVAIRKRLGLKSGDKVGFIMDGGGEIRVVNVSTLTVDGRAEHPGGEADHVLHEKKETPV